MLNVIVHKIVMFLGVSLGVFGCIGVIEQVMMLFSKDANDRLSGKYNLLRVVVYAFCLGISLACFL